MAGEVFSASFEKGLEGWSVPKSPEMVSVCDGDSASGSKSLQIVDRSESKGASASSDYFPAGKGLYLLKGKLKIIEGYGPGISLNFYDAGKNWLGNNTLWFGSKPLNPGVWSPFQLECPAYWESVAFAKISVNSDVGVMNYILVDDISVAKLPDGDVPPLWKPKYKVKPGESERLTPADVVGPDGIVYPDWTRAGVRGGIPKLDGRPVAKVEDFGAVADDGKDDSAAIVKAVESLKDGGVVLFGEGVYNLSRFVRINADFIVLKGQGRERSKILCDYQPPEDGVDLYGLKPGETIGPKRPIPALSRPKGLISIKLSANGSQFGLYRRSLHSGNTFCLVRSISEGKLELPKGPVKIEAEAEYDGGAVKRSSIDLLYDPDLDYNGPRVTPSGCIHFEGKGKLGDWMPLAKDALRGDISLTLASEEHGLVAGDLIAVRALETPARRALVRNACSWGEFRKYIVFVKAVRGAVIDLDQPLRIDFPAADEASVARMSAIKGCGVESLGFEQATDVWASTVLFTDALDCWARDVKVLKCGKNPVYFGWNAKFCAIRDCVFDDAWFKGGGGAAYVSWELAYDCLMENVETFKMRHAPLFQWSASGNVVRNGVFHDSDAQWHAGWPSENLMENCVVLSDTKENGGYGFGMWASPPEDGAHGPDGPRNVVYNCDVRSVKDGVWLGGMNENWIFAYNRFKVKAGAGVFLKTFSFDHIIKGNVFVLMDGKSPGVALSSPDCTGVELVDNLVYGGGGKLSEGLASPLVQSGNKLLPLDPDAPRPAPAVPSIYEWQLKNVKR